MSVKSPIIQIVGYKNSGKTTLLTNILTFFKAKYHYQVATIKHDAHSFQMDKKGTDTWKHRQAGADFSLIQSSEEIGITMKSHTEKTLDQLVHEITCFGSYDLLLVEGFKKESYPKIVLIRHQNDFNLISEVNHKLAIIFQHASDLKILQEEGQHVPLFLQSDEEAILHWVDGYVQNIRGKCDE